MYVFFPESKLEDLCLSLLNSNSNTVLLYAARHYKHDMNSWLTKFIFVTVAVRHYVAVKGVSKSDNYHTYILGPP